MIFVDTSAIYAFLSRDDQDHERVRAAFESALAGGQSLVATSYVVAETMGLVQRRLGLGPLARLVADVLPLVELRWVGPAEHRAAWQLLQEVGKRAFTIVDASSAAAMRSEGARRILALDAEFERLGCEVLPAPEAIG